MPTNVDLLTYEFTEEFPAKFEEYNFSEKQIERVLTESFTPERLQYASKS